MTTASSPAAAAHLSRLCGFTADGRGDPAGDFAYAHHLYRPDNLSEGRFQRAYKLYMCLDSISARSATTRGLDLRPINPAVVRAYNTYMWALDTR